MYNMHDGKVVSQSLTQDQLGRRSLSQLLFNQSLSQSSSQWIGWATT
jgi:hypothetical protein